METKEAPKVANPYARPTPGKCFKCNQPGHRSSYYPFRRAIHLAERDADNENKFFVRQMVMENMKRTTRMMMRGRVICEKTDADIVVLPGSIEKYDLIET